ncbi:amino acid-binding protein [Nocardia sp. NPDC051321]|uniref:amino acid-binding protein n=1 Tax=Nocardia sp. NPDC051321 TaxID=3364323 RepID=UPI0037B9AD9C
MRPMRSRHRVHVLACEVCGRLPHPRRARLTLAKLAAVFPVELALHALVVHLDPPYLVTVALLTISTTTLIIWVVEPSATRMLGAWLHGPELRSRDDVDRAPALWRIRVRVDDRPGRLEALARHLARRGANILNVHVHQLESGVLNELVIAAPAGITSDTLSSAVVHAGGSAVRIWPASAFALIDGQTKALGIATRVASDPDELPLAIAELLGARYLTPGTFAHRDLTFDGTTLVVPWQPDHPLLFVRPDEPFTPAENARAHRLTDLARSVTRHG